MRGFEHAGGTADPFGASDRRACEQAIVRVAHALGLEAHAPTPMPGASAVDWTDCVVGLAPSTGLKASFAELSLREALDFADQNGPLLTFATAAHRWIAIEGRSGTRVRVLDTHEHDAVSVQEIGTIASQLGLHDPDEQLVHWAVLEPAMPLDVIRSGDTQLAPHLRVYRLLRDEHRDLRIVLAYSIITGCLSLAVPIAVQALVNTIAFGSVIQPIVVLTIVVLAALLFEGTLNVLKANVVERLQERLFAKTATDVAERLTRVRTDALRGLHAPELVNRFFDVMTLQKAFAMLLLDGVSLLLQTVLGLVMLAFYHPLLLAFDVLLLGAIVFILFGLGQGAIETAVKESKAKYAVASWLEEIARGTVMFRARGARGFALGRIDHLTTRYVHYRRKHWDIFGRQLMTIRILYALASATLLGVGGWLVIERQLTLGQLVAAELIVAAVLQGLSKLSKHLESFYDMAASADKLGQLVDMPLETGGVGLPVATQRPVSIELRNVSVVVDGRGVALPSLRASAKDRVAIHNLDELRKRLTLEAIYGLHPFEGGTVLIDGVDVRQLDLAAHRDAVQLVREGLVFEGTIEDNVRVGRGYLSEARVHEALSAVRLLDDVLALKAGLRTHVVADGGMLSEGQTRRLLLARALVEPPRVLLIDRLLDGVEARFRQHLVELVTDPYAPWMLIVTTDSEEIARRCTRRHPGDAPASRSRVPAAEELS